MPSANSLNPAVILQMTATGLAVARSLGMRRVPLYGIDCNKFEIGHRSKFVLQHDMRYIHYKSRDLAEKLIEFAEKNCERKPVLYIAGDEYFPALLNDLPRLSQYYIVPASYQNSSIEHFLDKEKFYRKCSDLDLSIPKTYFIRNSNMDLRSLVQTIGFPLLLKPILLYQWKQPLRGKKLFYIQNMDELEATLDPLGERAHTLMIQELIPGGDDAIYQLSVYIDAMGRPREVMCSRKIRQHPQSFGVGSFIRSEWVDDLVKRGLSDLNLLGFKGICDIEYKLDSRGNGWRLIEVNPRVGMYFSLCEFAGINLIWNSYCDLIDRSDLIEHSRIQKDGLSWQYLARDLPSLAARIFHGAASWSDMRSFISVGRKIEPILSLSDMKCSLYYPIYILHKVFQF